MNEKSKSKFAEFMENFWYYHKFKVFVAILVLIVVINTASQLINRERPDYMVDIITVSRETDALGERLSQRLASVTEDANGDGETVVHVNVYHYDTDTQGNIAFAEDHGVHLAAEIQTGCVQLYIADSAEVLADTGLEPVGSWGDLPLLAGLAEEYGEYILYAPPSGDGGLLSILRQSEP